MQQPGGGSQYGAPPSEMSPFSSPGAGPRAHVLSIDPLHHHHQQPSTQPLAPENASPLSSRPPMSSSASSTPRPQASAFDELAPNVAGGFPDDDALAMAAGEEAERGAAAGNRWPRQETLALLKIRSEMDAAFRDATLKGPLWEDVSRKLAELGYKRSAKKCKEKFENVHKYYKRTKDGRAGRQDGKSYRFFSQLEALHSGGGGGDVAAVPNAATAPPLNAASPTPISFSAAMVGGPSGTRIQPSPISSVAPSPMAPAPARLLTELTPVGGQHGVSGSAATAAAIAGLSYSTNSSSSSSSEESDDEVTEDAGGGQEGRKRKRSNGGRVRSKSSRKMMAFFEGLMKQVMERQEAMQQRFLETIEKREQDRMIREEAWRRQEMARLTREQEVLAQERTMAATRDNALISYLQKVTGHTIPISTAPAAASTTIFATSLAPQATFVSPPPQPEQQPHQRSQSSQQKHHQKAAPMPVQPLQQQPPPLPPPRQSAEVTGNQTSTTELVAGADPQDTGGASVSFEASTLSPSRWPKAEVHALINLRSELDSRYQEAGPKGPLWEEISAGMQRLGYNRNAKRCKEKWENINKYFKKVKESNKKRPEDAKTCPYFHQLDALYRKKLTTTGGGSGVIRRQEQETDPYPERTEAMAPSQTSEQSQPSQAEPVVNGENSGGNSDSIEGSVGVQTANGALPSSYFEEGMKNPEDIMKELMEQRRQQNAVDDYDKLDSDNTEQDDDEDEDDDDDEESKMQYKIQYQRPQVNSSNGTGGNASTAAPAATTAAGSFVAMVQ